jgi:hypothetical protein
MGNELGTRNRNANTERRTAPHRKGDDIAERLLDLGAAVIKLLPALGRKPGGKAVVKQLEPKWTEACEAGRSPRRSTSTGSPEPARSQRCGPAGGSNYEEARGAESPADFNARGRSKLRPCSWTFPDFVQPAGLRPLRFVHKTRIALKEVRETRYWLRLAVRAELLDRNRHLAVLIDEADQLVAILTASANTARQHAAHRT